MSTILPIIAGIVVVVFLFALFTALRQIQKKRVHETAMQLWTRYSDSAEWHLVGETSEGKQYTLLFVASGYVFDGCGSEKDGKKKIDSVRCITPYGHSFVLIPFSGDN